MFNGLSFRIMFNSREISHATTATAAASLTNHSAAQTNIQPNVSFFMYHITYACNAKRTHSLIIYPIKMCCVLCVCVCFSSHFSHLALVYVWCSSCYNLSLGLFHILEKCWQAHTTIIIHDIRPFKERTIQPFNASNEKSTHHTQNVRVIERLIIKR